MFTGSETSTTLQYRAPYYVPKYFSDTRRLQGLPPHLTRTTVVKSLPRTVNMNLEIWTVSRTHTNAVSFSRHGSSRYQKTGIVSGIWIFAHLGGVQWKSTEDEDEDFLRPSLKIQTIFPTYHVFEEWNTEYYCKESERFSGCGTFSYSLTNHKTYKIYNLRRNEPRLPCKS